MPYRADVKRVPWAEDARMPGDYNPYQSKGLFKGIVQGSDIR